MESGEWQSSQHVYVAYTFEKLDRDHVAMLKCSVCARFKEKLRGCHNYNPAFVVGTKNLRASAFKDHAATEMHKRSMILLRNSRLSDVTQYTQVAKALSTIDPDTESKLSCKFEVAYTCCVRKAWPSQRWQLCANSRRNMGQTSAWTCVDVRSNLGWSDIVSE